MHCLERSGDAFARDIQTSASLFTLAAVILLPRGMVDFSVVYLYMYVSHAACNHSILSARSALVFSSPLAAVVAYILAVHREHTWRP